MKIPVVSAWALAFSFVAFLPSAYSSETLAAATSLAERLHSEAVEGWRFLENANSDVKCVFEQAEQGGRSGRDLDSEVVWSHELVYSDESFLACTTTDDFEEKVSGMNARYGFVVSRAGGTEDWLLRNVGPGHQSLASEDDIELGMVLRSSWCIYGVPLRAMIEHPGFSIDRLEEVDRNGVECVVLEFDAGATDSESRLMRRLGKGRVTLVPQLHWAIKEYEVQLLDEETLQDVGTTIAGEIWYADQLPDTAQFLALKQVDFRLQWQGGSKSWRSSIKAHAPWKARPDDFLLSSFGLPEPQLEVPAFLPTRPLGVFTAGLLLFLLAFVVRSRERRIRQS